MKKYFQIIGLLVLIGFSFFYTEKTITVVQEQDPIMIEINEKKQMYKTFPTDAIIDGNTIIPGIYGKEVDVDKSYNNMQKVGTFNEKLIVYKEIIPSITTNKVYNKYLTGGNQKYNNVALLFIVKAGTLPSKLNQIMDVIKSRNVKGNLFIDANYLNENINDIKSLSSVFSIYNYGDNGNYRNANLVMGNNIIKNLANEPSYCLTKEENKSVLEICEKNDMHTILANNYLNNNLYNEIKKNINNGMIIAIDASNVNASELGNVIDFISQKGYKIVSLPDLLNEKR